MILKYASNRIGYRKGYSLRVWLAVLDWNNNRNRNAKYTTSKISRRTKKRISQPILDEKSYSYLGLLLNRIIDRMSLKSINDLSANTPNLLSSCPPMKPCTYEDSSDNIFSDI